MATCLSHYIPAPLHMGAFEENNHVLDIPNLEVIIGKRSFGMALLDHHIYQWKG
jgi:hypothetical protein